VLELGDETLSGDRALHQVQQRAPDVFVVIDAILIALPSTVESNWKSIAHTTFGASASTGGIEDTPARLRGLCTRTCKPSSRHSR
jgi:hypothetical protein